MGFLVALGIFPDQALCDVGVNINDSCILSSNAPWALSTVRKSDVTKVLHVMYFFQPENLVWVEKEDSRC